MADELHFQNMIDTLQGAFIMADSATQIVMAANQLAAIQLGLSLPELLEQPLGRFLKQPLLDTLLRDVRQHELLYNCEGEMCSARGRCFPVQFSARVIAWRYPALIFTFTDHSQHQLLGELLKKKEQLFERVRLLTEEMHNGREGDPDDYISGILAPGQLLERTGIEIGHARRYHQPLAALQLHAEVLPLRDDKPAGPFNAS